MRIGVTGASGLIGTALRSSLLGTGHEVVPFVRRSPGPGEIEWHPERGELDRASLTGLDAIVHLAGAGIGDHRWNDTYRRELRSSRVDSTRLLAETMAGLGDEAPSTLLSGSAIGFYGDRGDEPVDESSGPGAGFLSKICQDWERATGAAEEAGRRVVHLRTGIVLSGAGGALPKMLPLFKLGLGGRFGSGRQWMSWIAIDDVVDAITHLLESETRGPVNLTAPQPVTNAEFARTLGRVLGRPALVPVPKFGPRMLLGRDRADSLLFDGQRVIPSVLTASGFAFRFDELDAGLRVVLDRDT